MGYNNSNIIFEKPKCLDNMIRFAEILSKEFLHARVDFYIVNGRIIFGEITFTNGAGFDKIKPLEFAVEMGELIKLPYNK